MCGWLGQRDLAAAGGFAITLLHQQNLWRLCSNVRSGLGTALLCPTTSTTASSQYGDARLAAGPSSSRVRAQVLKRLGTRAQRAGRGDLT